ncbi:hypothetical protein K9L05_04255 [Candidatus Babeliales bacterium]|nr:hypothetical protein [Candidatus Babeliales bacterium]MCF7899825.1 hypothetical protein [Candidatus Babeliales bacterium]
MKNIKKYFMAILATSLFFSANFAMEDEIPQDQLPTQSFPDVKPGTGIIVIISGISTSGKTKIADYLHNLFITDELDSQEKEETSSVQDDSFDDIIFSDENSNWIHLSLDEMKWQGLNINNLLGRKFKNFEKEYGKKQGKLSSINYYLCTEAIKKAISGINVICDTVLDEGGDNLDAFVSEIRSQGIMCYSVLVYCHINKILERLQKRNEDPDSENHRNAYENIIVPYSTMYSTSPRSDRSPSGHIGSLTKNHIRSISTSPLLEGYVKTQTQEEFQSRLESMFGFLNDNEEVYFYPKAFYNFYVENQDPKFKDENTPEICAKEIKAFIESEIGNSLFKPITSSDFESSSDENSDEEDEITETTTTQTTTNHDDEEVAELTNLSLK